MSTDISRISRPASRRLCRSRRRVSAVFAASLAAMPLATTACGDSNGLPNATFDNVVDTVTLGALVGTPISVPSAFSVVSRPDLLIFRGLPVRSDQTSAFDFAFNIDPTGRPVFLPLAVLGLGFNTATDPGLHPTTLAFADILQAPSNGYISHDTVPFAVGDRFVVRSRITCILSVPEYGKLEVLSLDETERTVTFQVLTNNNCGYKDLTPGLPNG